MRIISASIDLMKIDKSKIVTKNKEGQPFKDGAKYINIDIIVNDEVNEYGQDTAIKVNQSKEERESGVKATYLGNGKTVWTGESNEPKSAVAQYEGKDEDLDDLPF